MQELQLLRQSCFSQALYVAIQHVRVLEWLKFGKRVKGVRGVDTE